MKTALKSSVNRLLNAFDVHVTKKTTFYNLLAKEAENDNLRRALTGVGNDRDVQFSPLENFNHLATLGLTKRRQEHLASLGLDLVNRTVLEVGAGIGDHTGFFLDRGCKVLSTEGRPENLTVFRERWLRQFGWYKNIHNLEIAQLDVDHPPANFARTFEVVYCYGVLYHLEHPLTAIDFMARCCTSLLLLETSVSFGWEEKVIHAEEDRANVSQSIHGQGCHPSRPWIFSRLKERFEYVYMPVTQPWHEQFPTDWTSKVETPGQAQRAVFVASRQKLSSPMLVDHLPDTQRRM
jgi:Methyltransferase domain